MVNNWSSYHDKSIKCNNIIKLLEYLVFIQISSMMHFACSEDTTIYHYCWYLSGSNLLSKSADYSFSTTKCSFTVNIHALNKVISPAPVS